MIGRTLDHYHIREQIGAGGMGVVYRADDTRLGRPVALKMLPAEWNQDKDLQRRLAHEARAASALTHPGVAAVYDFQEHPEGSFIVFELVDGVTLRDWAAKRRGTLPEILHLSTQLADALSATHDHGIVHRDLKPANVMLTPGPDPPGRIKILDFGLAKLRKSPVSATGQEVSVSHTASLSTKEGLLVGTVNYMSPEQLEARQVDNRSDIYSLGLVLYELTTGTNPFVGSTLPSTIANILKLDPPSIPDHNPQVPAELDRILQKCLRKDPEERYQSARELLVDLVRLRKDSSSPGAHAPGPLSERQPAPALTISRGVARVLFALIQITYLTMYAVPFYKFTDFINRLETGPAFQLRYAIGLALLCGPAIRLYLLTAVGFDYEDLGRKFRILFPFLLAVDLAWAASPLLLLNELKGLAVVASAALAFLPFSQRTILSAAYGSKGGRSSSIRRRDSLVI